MAGRRKRKRKSIPKVGLLGEDVDAELAELLGQPREPLGQPVEGELPKVGLLSGEVDPAVEGILDEDFRSTLRMEDDRALGAEDERAFLGAARGAVSAGGAAGRAAGLGEERFLRGRAGREISAFPPRGNRNPQLQVLMMEQLRLRAEEEKRRRMQRLQGARERVGNPRMNPAAFGERRY